jgi:hypothetical protein
MCLKMDIQKRQKNLLHNLDKKIIIVGNGASLRNKKLGKKIDEFEEVVRFNDYQLDSFEEDVGTKTTIWARNNSDNVTDRILSQFKMVIYYMPLWAYNKQYINILKTKNIYIMPKEDLRDLQRQLSLIKRSLKTSGGGGLSSQKGWPSTGISAISILLSYANSITICGFDFFQTDDRQSEHYYDDKHGFIKTKCHKGEYEKEWILRKQKAGQITIL